MKTRDSIKEQRNAADTAYPVQRGWVERSGRERGVLSARIIAGTLVLNSETGKRFAEAWAKFPARIYGNAMPGSERDKWIIVLKQRVCTAAVIAPWNSRVR